jgi:quinol-cytochrome oxidoreductase complex cytochrome b subunit
MLFLGGTLCHFFCILRAIPDKTGGFLTVGAAVAALIVLPLVGFSEIRNPLFRPFYKIIVMFFFANFLLLGYLGQSKTKYPYYDVSQYATLYHFLFFFLVLIVSLFEKSLQDDKHREPLGVGWLSCVCFLFMVSSVVAFLFYLDVALATSKNLVLCFHA